VGLHHGAEEESPAKLRAAPKQHQGRTRIPILAEAAALLQSPAEYASPAPAIPMDSMNPDYVSGRYQSPLRPVRIYMREIRSWSAVRKCTQGRGGENGRSAALYIWDLPLAYSLRLPSHLLLIYLRALSLSLSLSLPLPLLLS